MLVNLERERERVSALRLAARGQINAVVSCDQKTKNPTFYKTSTDAGLKLKTSNLIAPSIRRLLVLCLLFRPSFWLAFSCRTTAFGPEKAFLCPSFLPRSCLCSPPWGLLRLETKSSFHSPGAQHSAVRTA